MESSKRIIILAAILIYNFLAWSESKNAPPNDVGTIEALIDAHKKMKKAEDLAVVELGTIDGEHIATQNLASKYNQTRTFLNQRMADVGSFITLTSSLLSITQQLKTLIEDYADFTKTCYSYALKKPFLLAIYTSANIQIAEEVKHIVKSCADYVGFQTNVLKSTMAEKKKLLDWISFHITSVQMILNSASRACRSVVGFGVKEYHVTDIINSETNKKIANKVIGKWKGS